MTFFSKNLHYIKFFPKECYHVFSTKTKPGRASIHRKKDFFPLKPSLVKTWQLYYLAHLYSTCTQEICPLILVPWGMEAIQQFYRLFFAYLWHRMALKRMEKAHLEKPKRGKGQCTLNRQLLGKQQKPKPKKPQKTRPMS